MTLTETAPIEPAVVTVVGVLTVVDAPTFLPSGEKVCNITVGVGVDSNYPIYVRIALWGDDLTDRIGKLNVNADRVVVKGALKFDSWLGTKSEITSYAASTETAEGTVEIVQSGSGLVIRGEGASVAASLCEDILRPNLTGAGAEMVTWCQRNDVNLAALTQALTKAGYNVRVVFEPENSRLEVSVDPTQGPNNVFRIAKNEGDTALVQTTATIYYVGDCEKIGKEGRTDRRRLGIGYDLINREGEVKRSPSIELTLIGTMARGEYTKGERLALEASMDNQSWPIPDRAENRYKAGLKVAGRGNSIRKLPIAVAASAAQ